jgi:hypothetical protein
MLKKNNKNNKKKKPPFQRKPRGNNNIVSNRWLGTPSMMIKTEEEEGFESKAAFCLFFLPFLCLSLCLVLSHGDRSCTTALNNAHADLSLSLSLSHDKFSCKHTQISTECCTTISVFLKL